MFYSCAKLKIYKATLMTELAIWEFSARRANTSILGSVLVKTRVYRMQRDIAYGVIRKV